MSAACWTLFLWYSSSCPISIRGESPHIYWETCELHPMSAKTRPEEAGMQLTLFSWHPALKKTLLSWHPALESACQSDRTLRRLPLFLRYFFSWPPPPQTLKWSKIQKIFPGFSGGCQLRSVPCQAAEQVCRLAGMTSRRIRECVSFCDLSYWGPFPAGLRLLIYWGMSAKTCEWNSSRFSCHPAPKRDTF